MKFGSCRRILLQAVLVGLFLAGPCLAQNSVRGPAAPPVPLTFKDGQPATSQAAQPAAQPAGNPAAEQPQPKFPNKDTAKNRQDYEMGTGTGSIQLGRDESSGDTVMRHNPPRKEQEQYPIEQQPINVWPVIPGGKGGRGK
jgi:hypothetical protein